MLAAFGLALAVGFLIFATWHDAVGAAIGAATSWLNFRWMRTSIGGVSKVLANQVPPRAARALLTIKFLLRYVVILTVLYATLKGSVASALGVFAGLLLIVPALMAEAVYEFYLGLRSSHPIS
jgi:hypothetical protein